MQQIKGDDEKHFVFGD